MTIAVSKLRLKTNRICLPVLLLLIGFFLAVLLRINIGVPDVASSQTAGIVFAACLIALSLSYGIKFRINIKNIVIGLSAGLFLCIPAIYQVSGKLTAHYGNYLIWSLVIITVACAEEIFLRGVLFEALSRQISKYWTILITALLFALLHLPLYGWNSMPLDFTVGLFLGNLRLMTKDFVAPAIAHSFADLLAWWI